MADLRGARRAAGFTLIEVLVVLVVAGIFMAFMTPSLFRFLQRSKIEGITRETGTMLQVARLESLRGRAPVRVVADYDSDQVYAFADLNRDGLLDAGTDRELARYPLPKGVSFWGAENTEPEQADALVTFDDDTSCSSCPAGGWADFKTDGTAAQTGAIRFGDERGNFLEVNITSLATGKVEIRKYDPESRQYWVQGEVGGRGKSWEWY
jgi:prepilin-type N-terminal cleavage/methylation domain-containing protein